MDHRELTVTLRRMSGRLQALCRSLQIEKTPDELLRSICASIALAHTDEAKKFTVIVSSTYTGPFVCTGIFERCGVRCGTGRTPMPNLWARMEKVESSRGLRIFTLKPEDVQQAMSINAAYQLAGTGVLYRE